MSQIQTATLCLLMKENSILLGWKKQGFGAGKVAGIGGRIENGESLTDCVCREMLEETSLVVMPADLTLSAKIAFRFPHKPSWHMNVAVFTGQKWAGKPQESDEIRPQWWQFDDIPYDKMWDDSRYWLPQVVAGEKIEAKFCYDANNKIVSDWQIWQRASFDESSNLLF